MPEHQATAAEPWQPKVRLLRPRQFAQHFGVENDPLPVQTIYGWVKRGYLRGVKTGPNMLWIPETEIDRLLIEGLPPSRPIRVPPAHTDGGIRATAP